MNKTFISVVAAGVMSAGIIGCGGSSAPSNPVAIKPDAPSAESLVRKAQLKTFNAWADQESDVWCGSLSPTMRRSFLTQVQSFDPSQSTCSGAVEMVWSSDDGEDAPEHASLSDFTHLKFIQDGNTASLTNPETDTNFQYERVGGIWLTASMGSE